MIRPITFVVVVLVVVVVTLKNHFSTVCIYL